MSHFLVIPAQAGTHLSRHSRERERSRQSGGLVDREREPTILVIPAKAGTQSFPSRLPQPAQKKRRPLRWSAARLAILHCAYRVPNQRHPVKMFLSYLESLTTVRLNGSKSEGKVDRAAPNLGVKITDERVEGGFQNWRASIVRMPRSKEAHDKLAAAVMDNE
jgi:hypothetical protein